MSYYHKRWRYKRHKYLLWLWDRLYRGILHLGLPLPFLLALHRNRTHTWVCFWPFGWLLVFYRVRYIFHETLKQTLPFYYLTSLYILIELLYIFFFTVLSEHFFFLHILERLNTEKHHVCLSRYRFSYWAIILLIIDNNISLLNWIIDKMV